MLSSAVRHGGGGLRSAPGLLRQVLGEESWRGFRTQLGEVVTHERFEEFVTDQPLRGLGVDVALVERIVADSPETVNMLDQVLQRPAGGHHVIDDNVNNDRTSPTGNSRGVALRRLRRDRPDLLARVVAGELSPHAAAVEAGFRQRTATVPVGDLAATARVLARHLDTAELVELAQLLDDTAVAEVDDT